MTDKVPSIYFYFVLAHVAQIIRTKAATGSVSVQCINLITALKCRPKDGQIYIQWDAAKARQID